MKQSTLRKSAILFGLLLTVSIAPSSASARSSVHIDLPHFSIGYSGNHHGNNHRSRKYDNRRHHNSRGYDRHYRGKHHYRSNRYSNHKGYRNYQPSTRYYDNNSYDRGYSSGYSSRNSRRDYSASYCPTDTYSSNYYRNRECYQHADHYHCEG